MLFIMCLAIASVLGLTTSARAQYYNPYCYAQQVVSASSPASGAAPCGGARCESMAAQHRAHGAAGIAR